VALGLRGGQRRPARRARDPLPLPGVRMSEPVPTDESSWRWRTRRPPGRTRRTRTSTWAASWSHATVASSRA
jgi:hypothetical protein